MDMVELFSTPGFAERQEIRKQMGQMGKDRSVPFQSHHLRIASDGNPNGIFFIYCHESWVQPIFQPMDFSSDVWSETCSVSNWIDMDWWSQVIVIPLSWGLNGLFWHSTPVAFFSMRDAVDLKKHPKDETLSDPVLSKIYLDLGKICFPFSQCEIHYNYLEKHGKYIYYNNENNN